MDAVDHVRRDINRALESERHIRSPQIIVDRLGQRHHIQPLFAQQVCRLVSPVSTQDHQTVKLQFVIILFHGLHLIQAILIRLSHQLKRRSGTSQDRSSLCQDTGKISAREHSEIAVDQSFITVQKSVDLYFLRSVHHCFHNATHSGIQSLTIAAAGQHTDSFHHCSLLYL